jgi:Ca2+-binding EF-hand superfamily protein
MSDFTLDDLNKAVQAKYKPWGFTAGRTKFSLKQILALPQEQREIVRAMLQKLDDDKADLTEDEVKAILKAALDYVVEDDKIDKLFEVLDNDLVKISILFEAYMEGTQAGEA